MFCKNCGQEIDDNVVVCPHCGVQITRLTPDEPKSTGNAVAIVGLAFAFLIPLVGLICSIIGYNNGRKYNAPYKTHALAGIIISIVAWILNIVVVQMIIKTFLLNM